MRVRKLLLEQVNRVNRLPNSYVRGFELRCISNDNYDECIVRGKDFKLFVNLYEIKRDGKIEEVCKFSDIRLILEGDKRAYWIHKTDDSYVRVSKKTAVKVYECLI